MTRKSLLIAAMLAVLVYPAAAGVSRIDAEETRHPAPAPRPASRTPGRAKRPGKAMMPLLVNKSRALPRGYVPAGLRPAAVPFACPEGSQKRLMTDEAARALERLFAQAEADGVALVGVSAYRSYDRQRAIHASQVQRYGEEEADRVSARPGRSEHQSGLAVDVSSPAVGGALVEAFGETPEGRWLAQNAPAFGFVIRYPKGSEDITGYRYEPWHLRYVGAGHALAMAEKGLTLEEYVAAETI
ncbi:MAG: D-alanyl-D-alanine carboxypeptidase family protein [Patescibacteria group bacterium]